MANTQLSHIIETVKVLSVSEKQALLELLSQELKASPPEPRSQGSIQFGWAKGLVTIAPDFDEPLEDLQEYLE